MQRRLLCMLKYGCEPRHCEPGSTAISTDYLLTATKGSPEWRLRASERFEEALRLRAGGLGIKISSRELSAPWCARCSISLLDVLKSYALEDIAAREFPA
jgi:hypothetical protein